MFGTHENGNVSLQPWFVCGPVSYRWYQMCNWYLYERTIFANQTWWSSIKKTKLTYHKLSINPTQFINSYAWSLYCVCLFLLWNRAHLDIGLIFNIMSMTCLFSIIFCISPKKKKIKWRQKNDFFHPTYNSFLETMLTT